MPLFSDVKLDGVASPKAYVCRLCQGTRGLLASIGCKSVVHARACMSIGISADYVSFLLSSSLRALIYPWACISVVCVVYDEGVYFSDGMLFPRVRPN